jgi:hypothetical protein
LQALQEQVQSAEGAPSPADATQPEIAATGEAAGTGAAAEAATEAAAAAEGGAGANASSVGRPNPEVALALRRAPGLSTASAAEIDALGSLLQGGVCVTDALREVFGTINRQTLVSLLRELGGC